MNAKPAKNSAVTMTEIVLPGHANALGTIFGGQVMSWIDIASAMSNKIEAFESVTETRARETTERLEALVRTMDVGLGAGGQKLQEKLGTNVVCPHGNRVGVDRPRDRRERGWVPLDEATGAVGDELGDVLGSDEQALEHATQRGGQCALAA